jgi:hypothetical protein
MERPEICLRPLPWWIVIPNDERIEGICFGLRLQEADFRAKTGAAK